MKKTLHFRHGLAAMTATIVMLFAQLLATNAHTSGISPATESLPTASTSLVSPSPQKTVTTSAS